MADGDFTSVDDYIAGQPAAAQPMLRQLRKIVKAALPDATEKIAYNMPTYRLNNRNVTYFGAAKKHCALYGVKRQGFEKELEPYGDVSKGTIRFPLADPLPADLVRRLVLATAGRA